MSKRERLVARAFEAAASGYEEQIARSMSRDMGLEYSDFLQILMGLCGAIRGCNTLDLATGTGNVAIAAARAGKGKRRVAAIDLTDGMLSRAKRKVEEAGLGNCIHVCKASGEALPFADDSFGLVTCSIAFHHMPVPKALKELSRVLTPQGSLVMADMAAAPAWRTPWGRIIAPIYLILRRLKEKRPLRIGSKMYTPLEWTGLLADSGFSITQEKCFSKGNWRPRLVIISATLQD